MMKSSKKLTALLLAGLMMTTAACGTKNEPAQGSGSSKGEATITKTAKGFGGDVTVTVNFDKDGKLTSVEAAGDEETPTIGGQAIQELPAKIVDAGSAEVDGVAGATITSSAIKTAVQEAIDEYNGTSAEIPAAKMKAGTYTVTASGFSLLKEMEVAVTVSEDKIENIEVLDNGDTYPFLEAAKEKLIPRILENQSVTVDSITGCTGSSTGIKQATEKAVAQALAEGVPKRRRSRISIRRRPNPQNRKRLTSTS